MSERLHPGSHPDADSLNAFIEGVLPEHERRECLAHFAECERCREVVFLAQEPQPAPAAPKPVSAWRRWLAPIPVLSAAAAAGILAVGVSMYLRQSSVAPPHDVVTHVEPPPPAPPPPVPEIRKEAPVSSSVTAKARPNARPPFPRDYRTHYGLEPGPIPASYQQRLLPPPPTPADADAVRNQQMPPALVAALPRLPSPPTGLTGIAGTVTDQSGAAIPGATVTLRLPTGTPAGTAQTDGNGEFKIAEVPAGRYRLQIASRGFQQVLEQIELKGRDLAVVNRVLSVGAITETVEVSASSAAITTSASAAKTQGLADLSTTSLPPAALPSKLPAATIIGSGKVTLALDSTGSLFFSRDAGKYWKAVKPIWRGKAVGLVTLPETAAKGAVAFQLTTDSGSVWLSRDGTHWNPAPAHR